MVCADKGYHGQENREFLSLNRFGDGIMRKDTTTAKLIELEKTVIKEYPKFAILWSGILVSATSMIAVKESDLQA